MTFLKYSNVSIFLYSMAVASRFVLTQAVAIRHVAYQSVNYSVIPKSRYVVDSWCYACSCSLIGPTLILVVEKVRKLFNFV